MKRLLPILAFSLLTAEVAVVLTSWLLAAAFPTSGISSLLSGEGVRWLCVNFASMQAAPFLIWLLMLSMAWSSLRSSGMLQNTGGTKSRLTHREKRAWIVAFLTLVVFMAIMLILTAWPHAILLSATGQLFPSPFSEFLIPYIALCGVAVSVSYGAMAGNYPTIHSIYNVLIAGLKNAAPLLLFYFLLSLLFHTIAFAFPLNGHIL